VSIPRATAYGDRNLLFVEEVFHCVASRMTGCVGYLVGRTIEDDFTSKTTCIRAYIDDVISSTHDVFVVLYYNYCVSKRLQFLENMDEAFCVSGMEAYAWFIEYVERAYETASETCCEVYSLALATREGVGETI
jgi:hypothetical protein